MIKAIIQHELTRFFKSAKFWYLLALFQVIMGSLFYWLLTHYQANLPFLTEGNLIRRGLTEEVLHPYYAWFSLLFLLWVPVGTTEMISQERSNKTWINYCMCPVCEKSILLGKFFALLIFLLIILSCISLAPFTLAFGTDLDWGQCLTSLFGICLFLGCALSIGLCISSFSSQPILTNFITLFTLISLILLEWGVQFLGSNGTILQHFGLLNPLKSFLAGMIVFEDILYYLTFSIACLTLSLWRVTWKPL